MSTIAISDLNIAGISLFEDRETYLNDIDDTELGMVKGGTVFTFVTASSPECAAFVTGAIASAGGAISIAKAFRK